MQTRPLFQSQYGNRCAFLGSVVTVAIITSGSLAFRPPVYTVAATSAPQVALLLRNSTSSVLRIELHESMGIISSDKLNIAVVFLLIMTDENNNSRNLLN
jgi:hypothetical protein